MSVAQKIGKYAYCPSHVNFFKGMGQWYPRGTVTPRAGDIIFFQSGGEACHVGIVTACNGGTVYTIEGNTSGASGLIDNGGGVCRKSYPVGSGYILGYGRPGLTSDEVARLLAVATAEVGYLEKAGPSQLDSKTGGAGRANYTKYSRDIWPGLQAQPWCDIFVSWCAIQADKAAGSTGGSSESTPGGSGGGKTEDQYSPWRRWTNGSTKEPVYRDSDLEHQVDMLGPYKTGYCMSRYGDAYAITYRIDGTDDDWAIGWVKYRGGV